MSLHNGMVAQSVEHLPEEQSVVGATPTHSTIFSLDESKRFWRDKIYQIYLSRHGKELRVYETKYVEGTKIETQVIVDSTEKGY